MTRRLPLKLSIAPLLFVVFVVRDAVWGFG